jgi:hypothetical protein
MSSNVYKKLQAVRNAFLSEPIKKSGKNKFAGYEYFELGDFIPTVHRLFDQAGLIGVVRFYQSEAMLTIYNSDSPEEFIVFTTPIVFANNPKGQAIQDLGSTHTYMRRYLWLMALEITEHDSVDAVAPVGKSEKVDPKPTPTQPEKPAVEAPNPADQDLFVEKMIEWGLQAQDKSALTDLWKSNQKQVDELKSTNADAFKKLQTAFAEIKSNIEE